MEIFDSTKLNGEYTASILKFIKSKQSAINTVCVNTLIRDDIFPLLDTYCTVIYYPRQDKENNGFHTIFFHEDQDKHFVYINTAQHKEKQIFTAAHELGHIWELKSFVEKEVNYTIDDELDERIVNRFASELLMPKNQFEQFVIQEMTNYLDANKFISEVDMIKVITSTMHHFFTSYKSVIYRFYETGMLDEQSCRVLWGETREHSREDLIELSMKIAKEKGYSRLYQTDERKWIDGLKELLDKASETNKFSVAWLESFYEKFDFDSKPNKSELKDSPSIRLQNGVENDK